MFRRHSADRYESQQKSQHEKDVGRTTECDEFLQILLDVQRTSAPISFETLDLIAGNQEADKAVLELIGKEVDDEYRY